MKVLNLKPVMPVGYATCLRPPSYCGAGETVQVRPLQGERGGPHSRARALLPRGFPVVEKGTRLVSNFLLALVITVLCVPLLVYLTTTFPDAAMEESSSSMLLKSSWPPGKVSECGERHRATMTTELYPSEQALVRKYAEGKTSYLEWGTGGSTDLFSRHVKGPAFPVENHPKWCKEVQKAPPRTLRVVSKKEV